MLAALLVALAALAWAALWAVEREPLRRAISRTAAGATSARSPRSAARCPQGEVVVPALLHALAWVLMIAAMMLPTTLSGARAVSPDRRAGGRMPAR